MTAPLKHRLDLVELPPSNALTRSLRELGEHHRLAGCVLVTFDVEAERIGTCSWAKSDGLLPHMTDLADRILAKIADGEFDP